MPGFGKTGSMNIKDRTFIILSQRVSFFSPLKKIIRRITASASHGAGCFLHKSACVLKFPFFIERNITVFSNCNQRLNKGIIINGKTFGLTIFLQRLSYSIMKGKGGLRDEA